jgi:DNA-binding transcriptional regulator YiaG
MTRRKASSRLDVRKHTNPTSKQTADVLDGTVHTTQNWETGSPLMPKLSVL